MSGPVIIRTVMATDPAVAALVPPERIIADEVAPQGTDLPLVLVKHVSGIDRIPLKIDSDIHTIKRVQVEIQASNAEERDVIKLAIRKAGFRNQFPTVEGFANITLRTEAEGPDFYVESTKVRIGEQDFIVTYSEQI